MIYNYHLPTFAPGFAEYLNDNLVGRLSTGDIGIKIGGERHTLSIRVYLHDTSFNDEIYLGEYASYFLGNQKVKQEFRSDSLPLGHLFLLYEADERKDAHAEIPFP